MEIERINENTVKFFISYIDIEDRGFKREEIWYNREKSEQLFWEMMEEVNYKEDFRVEGPLWIQVQAMEKGLEVIVTKSKATKDGRNIILPEDDMEEPILEEVESLLGKTIREKEKNIGLTNDAKNSEARKDSSLIAKFNSFEDVIQFSHYSAEAMEKTENKLYSYQDKYYLYVKFSSVLLEATTQENLISMIYEFANETELTIHLLEEYGREIFKTDTLNEVKSYFKAQ